MTTDLYQTLGWMFLSLAGFFALGLAAPFARYFYPRSPGFSRRLAAPLIFGALAGACFIGLGLAALFFVVLLGLALIAINRRRPAAG